MSVTVSRLGCVVPAFFSPTSLSWDKIISSKLSFPNVPIAVIINAPVGAGATVDTNYSGQITRLKNAGIITLGYVWSNFGNSPLADIENLIDSWKTLYPSIDGIYFDAMSNQTSAQSYYAGLDTYAKTTKGFTSTMGNAAAKVPTTFFGGNTLDTIIVYQGAGLPLVSNYQDYTTITNNEIGLIPFGISALDLSWLQQMAGIAWWIYVTNDSGSAPFDTLPSYFNSMISAMNDIASSGGTPTAVVDNFGIQKIYHTKSGGEEWYVNMANPTSDERFQNVDALTKLSDGSWRLDGGTSGQVRLEAWSPAYTDTTQRINAKWFNVEMTCYAKTISVTSGASDYAYQLYSRGGHHTDSRPCEGSALKFRVFRNGLNSSSTGAACAFMKEICHSAYCTDHRGIVDNVILGGVGLNKWLGVKHVIYNVVESGVTYSKQEGYLDLNVTDAEGNLHIDNNWKLITSYVDRGGWSAGSSFDTDCTGCGRARDALHITPGGNTTSGSADFNRNLVAWRTDGVTWAWKFLTAREIDPAKPANTGGGGGGGGGGPPEPGDLFDQFGVRKIYPTATSATGKEWYMSVVDPKSDVRFKTANTLTKNADGSWKTKDTAVKIEINQPNGYNASTTGASATNHSNLAARGYMQDSNDWKNIEMTIYLKVNATTADDYFIFWARGGREIDPGPNCEGCSLKGYLRTDGLTQMAKQQWHISQITRQSINQTNQSLIGKWIGVKFVVFNEVGTVGGNNIQTRQQMFLDSTNTNTWIKVDETADTGGWGNADATCAGTADQLILWGGPMARISWSTFADTDFAKFSIREIDGAAVPNNPGQPNPPSSCAGP